MCAPRRAGEVGGAGEQRVGGEVVADERHPAVRPEPPARQERRAWRPGGPASRRSGRRTARARCPSPTRRARPGCRCARRPSAAGARWPIVPASITVVTPLSRLSTNVSVAARPSSSGVCASFSGTAQEKIDSPGGEVVGHAAAGQRVAGRVLVGVDEAGRDDAAGGVELGGAGVGGADLGGRADGDDAPAADGDGAVEDDPPLGVDRQQVAAGDEQVGASLNRGPARRRTRCCCRRDR